VVSGKETSGIDFSLTSGGKIVGWVTAGGGGVPYASLNAWSMEAGGGWGWAETNATGYYELTGLTTGSYEVEVWPPADTGYASSRERGVDVVAGVTTQLDFSLSSGGCISGRVTAGDEAVQYANVNAWSREGGGGWAETDYNGNYTIVGLTAGSYEVNVEPPWGSNYASEHRMGIAVTEGDTSTCNFELSTGGSISGRVTAGDAAVQYANVNAWSREGGWGWTQTN